jgi:hypothetical protein
MSVSIACWHVRGRASGRASRMSPSGRTPLQPSE